MKSIVVPNFLVKQIMADIEYLCDNMVRSYEFAGYIPDMELISSIKDSIIAVSVNQLGATLDVVKELEHKNG